MFDHRQFDISVEIDGYNCADSVILVCYCRCLEVHHSTDFCWFFKKNKAV